MASPVSPTDRCRAAIEAHAIHRAVCRHRAQGPVCSTCFELSDRADRAEQILGLDVVEPPATEDLAVTAGIVSWSRRAA